MKQQWGEDVWDIFICDLILARQRLQIETFSINIHEWREESSSLWCGGRREGRGRSVYSTWRPIYSCIAASLGLLPRDRGRLNLAAQRQKRGAGTKIETSLWSEHTGTASGGASLGRTERNTWRKQRRRRRRCSSNLHKHAWQQWCVCLQTKTRHATGLGCGMLHQCGTYRLKLQITHIQIHVYTGHKLIQRSLMRLHSLKSVSISLSSPCFSLYPLRDSYSLSATYSAVSVSEAVTWMEGEASDQLVLRNSR